VEALQERLAGTASESAATRSLLVSLLSSSQRAGRLVAQLLALMRSDSPQASLAQAEPQRLGDLAQESLAAASPLARLTDVELELQGDVPGPVVRGDREGLSSLLQNLIENGIKYSPARGRVLVSVEDAATGPVLTICDEGPGIAEEFRERVFERFYRVPSQAQTGSGLGLAIVKAITDRLGATISLGTPEWGYGLQVRIAFPRT
jgi:two-component system sensor histidine kinase QseC